MASDLDKHHRRSIRLRGYDYSESGAYFITLCAHQRECLFGEIIGDEMRLNEVGDIVREEWLRTPLMRPDVELDAFIVMPNHIHAIIVFVDSAIGARHDTSLPTSQTLQRPGRTLGTFIRGFKSVITSRVNTMRNTSNSLVWQRNYYEQIVRDERMLNNIRGYIETNPAQWTEDNENPINVRAGKYMR